MQVFSMSNDDNEIRAAFPTETLSTCRLLSDKRVVIPAYQRRYSWGEQDIKHLIEDIFQSCAERRNEKDTALLTFLGTIIMTKTGGEKMFDGEQASADSFYSVVDGQQRLSTVSIMGAVLLHRADFLNHMLSEYKNSYDEDTLENKVCNNIALELSRLSDDLLQLISEEIRTGNGKIKKRYPRLLRALEDRYSNNNDKDFKFTSSLCTYIYNTVAHLCGQDEHLTCSYPEPDRKRSVWACYEPLGLSDKVFDDPKNADLTDLAALYIEKVMTFVCMGSLFRSGESESRSKILRQKFMNRSTFYKLLTDFDSEFEAAPIGITEPGVLYRQATASKEEVGEDVNVFLKQDEDCFYAGTLEFILFAQSFLYSVVFNLVSPSTEDYAFSMFDSLNTTGQVLTAYETFRARMVNSELNFPESKLKKYLDAIDSYFDSDPKQKEELTDTVLIAFARASEGFTLSHSLNAQRRFLRNLADKAQSAEGQLDLVRHLYMAVKFFEDAWLINSEDQLLTLEIRDPASGTVSPVSLSPEASLGLSVLVDSKHYIVIAVLLKFYCYFYYAGSDEERDRAKRLFNEAVMTVCAFSAFYRLTRRGTSGIDTYYKNLFKDQETRLAWFLQAKSSPEPEKLLRFIKDGLRDALAKCRIESFDKWQEAFTENDVYTACRSFALYAIFIHCISLKDPSSPQVRTDYFPQLFDNSSLEHIAPQSDNRRDAIWQRWDDLKVYEEDGKLISTIGNLTILNKDLNAFAGNSAWEFKKLAYRWLSAQDGEKREEAFKDLSAYIAANPGMYHKPKKPLSRYNSMDPQIFIREIVDSYVSWDCNNIRQRSQQIAKSVWNYLAPYLDLEKA